MDLAKNKYVQSAGRYALAFGTLSVAFLSFGYLRRNLRKSHETGQYKLLSMVIIPEVLDIISRDRDYIDILSRLLEFQSTDPVHFDLIVRSIHNIIVFLRGLSKHITMTDSMNYVKLGHMMIENVRLMRALLELKMPSALQDFDEIAVDIQTKYDEDREGLLFDAQLRW